MTRTLGLAAVAVMAALALQAGRASSADPALFLKCESTREREKRLQDHFVKIEALRSGAEIEVVMETDSSRHLDRFEITRVGENMIWARRRVHPSEKYDNDRNPDRQPDELRIYRDSGRMQRWTHVPKEDAQNLWNEKKQQLGGFEEDPWFAAKYECEKTERAF